MTSETGGSELLRRGGLTWAGTVRPVHKAGGYLPALSEQTSHGADPETPAIKTAE